MRRALLAIACVCLAFAGTAEARGRRHVDHVRHPIRPVVVELFTSQGCSACIAADELVDQLADEPGVLPLTFAVDYWDYLGWSDTFAKPEFSARQKAYEHRLALRDLYTPQIIVDGEGQLAGAEPKRVEALIKHAQRREERGPRMRFLRHSRLLIGHGRRPPGGADVWLVRYDPAAQKVVVKRGENRGRTLLERNVVSQLSRLGGWYGREKTLEVPADGDGAGLKTAILLQEAKGGRILAVLQR